VLVIEFDQKTHTAFPQQVEEPNTGEAEQPRRLGGRQLLFAIQAQHDLGLTEPAEIRRRDLIDYFARKINVDFELHVCGSFGHYYTFRAGPQSGSSSRFSSSRMLSDLAADVIPILLGHFGGFATPLGFLE